jgi:hypothetical protein
MATPSIYKLMQQGRTQDVTARRASKSAVARSTAQKNYDYKIFQEELAKAKAEASKGFSLGQLISTALFFVPVVGPALSATTGFILPYEMADDHIKGSSPGGKYKGQWNSQMDAIDAAFLKESIEHGTSNVFKYIPELQSLNTPWLKGTAGGTKQGKDFSELLKKGYWRRKK